MREALHAFKFRGRRALAAPLGELLVEEATVDAYGEAEQTVGWFTMIQENLAVPFDTMVLGVPVTVERLDLDASERIVAVCARGKNHQSLPILDLPLLGAGEAPPAALEGQDALISLG